MSDGHENPIIAQNCIELSKNPFHLLAIKADEWSLSYNDVLRIMTPKDKHVLDLKQQIEAVSNYPRLLEYIANPDNSVINLALDKFDQSLAYCETQTLDLCFKSILNFPLQYKLITIVPTPDYHTTIANLEKKKLIVERLGHNE